MASEILQPTLAVYHSCSFVWNPRQKPLTIILAISETILMILLQLITTILTIPKRVLTSKMKILTIIGDNSDHSDFKDNQNTPLDSYKSWKSWFPLQQQTRDWETTSRSYATCRLKRNLVLCMSHLLEVSIYLIHSYRVRFYIVWIENKLK